MWPANVTRCDQLDHLWPMWPDVINVTIPKFLWPLDHMWSLVTMWYVTRCYQCYHMLPNPFDHLDHMWPHVTTCDQVIPNLVITSNPTSVTLVTHSSYSSYPLQLLRLLSPVTPVTNFSYSGYPLQLLRLSTPVTLITHSSYSGYQLQLLWVPTPVTQVTPVTYSSPPLCLRRSIRSGPCWIRHGSWKRSSRGANLLMSLDICSFHICWKGCWILW